MAVAGVQQLTGLLCCDVGQFLRSRLLIGKSLDAVLEGLILADLVLEDLLLFSLLDAGHSLRAITLVGEAPAAELVHANGARPYRAIVQRRCHAGANMVHRALCLAESLVGVGVAPPACFQGPCLDPTVS